MVAVKSRKINKNSEPVKIADMWLRHHTGPGYGRKTPVGVRHKLRRSRLEHALTQGWSGLYPPLYALTDHCLEENDTTLYMTGSDSSDYIFLMIDVDVLKALQLGSIEGGRLFIRYLASVWPDLYCEESTNHKGQHGYIRLHCPGLNAIERNALAKKLDSYVKWLAKLTNADIENVEIKGTCKIITYQGRKATVHKPGMGQLAKIPRGLLTRMDQLDATPAISVEDVERLYESIPLEERTKQSLSHGSCAFLRPDHKAEIDALGKYCLIERLSNFSCSDRSKVYASDFGYGLWLLRKIFDLPSEDGSLANARIEKHWNDGVSIGLHNKRFNPRVWKVIRDTFSSLGSIEWLDNSYVPGMTLTSPTKVYSAVTCLTLWIYVI